MEIVKLGDVAVSRFILGSNPISGFSHQGPEMDRKMMHYYSAESVKRLLRKAEALGITTILGRTDAYMRRLLMEYWDEGGKVTWLAQSCPEAGLGFSIRTAVEGGAKTCHVHGGTMDYLVAQDKVSEAVDAVKRIHDAGLPAGIAGHTPRVFEWGEEHLEVEYYLVCYYNPTPRENNPVHDPMESEYYRQEDRENAVKVIAGLSRPVVHYKIMAAGRNEPAAAFGYAARHMRDGDGVCVGIYDGEKRDMLAEDVQMFEEALAAKKR